MPTWSGKSEVLSPAGDIDALRAAVRSGADAVYFGLQDYNARVRARNFSIETLGEVLAELHRDGVKGYVTFNTLLFAEEEAAARKTLLRIAAARPDAVIVQDLGVARWIHERDRDLVLHASTQMTISSIEGITFLQRFGIRRVILARELTLPEITRLAQHSPIELEVFVHGALCVSYSGQCMSSEAWGGRSANRGQCAQACRLPYEMLVDGARRDLGDRAFLLSPRDLEGYRRIPELVAAGIHGFKIEGRMKSAEYVAAATALYREAVDHAFAGKTGNTAKADIAIERKAERARRVFSRGGSEGFLGGVNHQVLVDGRIRSHRGVRLGTVTAFARGWIEVDPEPGAPSISPGDGLLIAHGPQEEDETGGKIFGMAPAAGGRFRVQFGRSMGPEPDRIRIGSEVYLTHDHRLQAELQRALGDPNGRKRIALDLEVRGAAGEKLFAVYRDPEGRFVEVTSESALEEAIVHPLDETVLREHLGRLGASRYHCDRMRVALDGSFALPVSELNRMRRAAVEAMETLRASPTADTAAQSGSLGRQIEDQDAGVAAPDIHWIHPSPVRDAVERAETVGGTDRARGPDAPAADPFLVLCRTREQVDAALEAGAQRIVLDFLDLVGLRAAAEAVRLAGRELTLALPRIQKPGEERIWDFFLARKPDAILVRNLASLNRLASRAGGAAEPRSGGDSADTEPAPALIADASLNAVNPTAVRVLLDAGCTRVSPGLDLNGEQLVGLASTVPAERLEVPLHHHLPVFHTEHCVFAAFLSDGADWRTCGRPCDRHAIHLRDRTGQEHAVIADVGCRNTVFGARPQSVLHLLADMRRLGVAHFRLELLEQNARATAELLRVYRDTWNGLCAPDEGLQRLRAEARFGIFGGSPEPPRKPDWKPQGGRRPQTRAGRSTKR
jgi:U32 family peptidase